MRRKGSLLRELPILVVVALVVSLLIKTFLVQFFYIPSGSMENTLQIKDRVAVNKVPFLSRNIARGDVVVFRDPAGWLPEMIDYSTNKYVAKVKTGLVAVGVLPNPAKQYLVKRVIGVGGDRIGQGKMLLRVVPMKIIGLSLFIALVMNGAPVWTWFVSIILAELAAINPAAGAIEVAHAVAVIGPTINTISSIKASYE